MPARLQNVEKDIAELKTSVAKLETTTARLVDDVGDLKVSADPALAIPGYAVEREFGRIRILRR